MASIPHTGYGQTLHYTSDIEAEFTAGHFTVHKTHHLFSALALDQGHEQENAIVKDECGAVGLKENAAALRLWIVAGPEVARVIQEFEQCMKEETISSTILNNSLVFR
jgi:hypothetical protein